MFNINDLILFINSIIYQNNTIDEYSIYEYSIDKDEYSIDKDEYFIDKDEYSIDKDKYFIDTKAINYNIQDENFIDEVSMLFYLI
jgi:hypothetical protein